MRTEFEGLDFSNQCALIALEIMLQVIEGRRGKGEVERVINDLLQNIPWRVKPAEVEATANRVATYGIQELPNYVEPEETDVDVGI